MAPRSVLVVFAAVVAGVLRTAAYAESPPPTVLVPEAPLSTDRAGMYATIGFGPADDTDRLQGHSPVVPLTLGVSLPIRGRAYVDVGMYFSTVTYSAEPSLTGWGNNADLRTFAITASGRFGHTGKKAAVFGSAGFGFAYVRLGGGDYFYGAYSPPLDTTVAPVLTVAGSFEAPARKRNRFLAELRYSWIHADFGSTSGGSLNVGGPALLLGWKGVF
jgi:hypothetical protein